MKTILALFLAFICFTSIQCTFTPEWSRNCEGFVWKTDNVTLDDAPAAGQNSTFHICGTNKQFYLIDFQKILVISENLLNLTFPDNTSLQWRQSHCFDLNFQIPKGSKILKLDFILQADLIPYCGCFNVTLYPKAAARTGTENFLSELI